MLFPSKHFASPIITKPRIFSFVAALLIPLAAIIYGIFLLLNHALFNLSFLITFLLLPVCAVFLLKKLIFSSVAAFVKALAALLLLGGFAALFFFSALAGRFESLERYRNDSALAHYEEINAAFPAMPAPDDPNNTQRAEYYRYTGSQFLFMWNADILICRYNESDYAAEKASLDIHHLFQTEPMNAGGTECLPQAEIDGYAFRVLAINNSYAAEIDYPKRLVLIGTNDKAKEIAYIAFRDPDIDHIDDLRTFILDNCGWRRVR